MLPVGPSQGLGLVVWAFLSRSGAPVGSPCALSTCRALQEGPRGAPAGPVPLQ